ncbi:MAG: class I SAM-dependent methyltransferase [Anaerolineae bacterium]
MIEEFFVPPSNVVSKWVHRFIGKAFPLLPRRLQRNMLRSVLNGEAGVRWAENYARMPPFEPSVHAKWRVVDKAVAEAESIHWIGCCSGREVAFFAACYPQKPFIASDLSASIIQWCQKRYDLPNLQFQRVDATRHDFGEDLVVAMGVMTYMDAEEVTRFSRHVRRLVSAEPVTEGYDERSSSYRSRMSWNHPYRQIFNCRHYEEIPNPGGGVSVVFTVGIDGFSRSD